MGEWTLETTDVYLRKHKYYEKKHPHAEIRVVRGMILIFAEDMSAKIYKQKR